MALRIGPGAMVAAAFIGPGTVTTASVAGASSGIALLWAVAFSVFATLTLQELSLRTALPPKRIWPPWYGIWGGAPGGDRYWCCW